MKITFGKWQTKTSCSGPYHRQYFYAADKPLGCILRFVEQPWSDCNNQVTTHYEVTWLYEFAKKLADQNTEIVFPVLDAAAYVTETGACMNADDFLDPTKIAELHAAFLDCYCFQNKQLGEPAKTARQAGRRAKQYIKQIAAQYLNQ